MKNNSLSNYTIISKIIEIISSLKNKNISSQKIASELSITVSELNNISYNWCNHSFDKLLNQFSLKFYTTPQKSNNYQLFTDNDDNIIFHNLINIIQIKNNQINIYYFIYTSKFGKILIANSIKGIYYMAFIDENEDDEKEIQNLKNKNKSATYILKQHSLQKNALNFIDKPHQNKINLHIGATNFQLKVWTELLNIPLGKVATYGEISKKINQPNASRAVGTAIGKNPIAYLIPCHRVIKSDGKTGEYMWGAIRKQAILYWEKLNM